MKLFKGLLAAAIIAVTGTTVDAQTGSYPAQTPTLVMSGHFNSTTAGAGTKTTSAMAERMWKQNENVLYTKLDTVSNTGVDTFKAVIKGEANSVYTWCRANLISGTNTSCTVRLLASGDNASANDYAVLYTATVTATNPVATYMFNSGNKWPYSKFWWVWTGSGTHSTSWYAGLLWR